MIKQLLALRKDLDALIGVPRRSNLFAAIFSQSHARYPVMRSGDGTHMRLVAMELTQLGFVAEATWDTHYPTQCTVWVNL